MPRIAIAAIADRLVDTLVLLSLAGTAVWVAGLPPGAALPSRLSGWWLVVPLLVAAGAVVAARRLHRGPRRERVRAAAAALLARPGAVALAFAAGLSVQSTFVLTNVWLASEVGMQTALAPWFLAWTAAKLGALLPISLGGIGVREAALVSLMAAYGAPPDAVLATGILWEAALIAGSLGGFLVTQLARR
jgi:uncharacterized membrane protein YbhN (UPF0104 family)